MRDPLRGAVLPTCRCPACGSIFDRAGGVLGANQPKPGSYSICIHCRNVNVFAPDLTVREATDQELVAVAGDPRLRAVINALAKAHSRLDQARQTNSPKPVTASSSRQ